MDEQIEQAFVADGNQSDAEPARQRQRDGTLG
jgi:hypothetical protein